MTNPIIQPMFEGPIDIVGDIHGELGALRELMSHLGYDSDGRHGDNSHLIFVGDLCDRGPDSPGVALLVKRLVDAGRAQCVLGNHELNILRQAKKLGNGWWHVEDHDRAKGRHLDCRRAGDIERDVIYDFFASLPLALERDDLRVIHAAWDDNCLAQIGRDLSAGGVAELYRRYSAQIQSELEADGTAERAKHENAELEHVVAAGMTPDRIYPALADADARKQMSNPISVGSPGTELEFAL